MGVVVVVVVVVVVGVVGVRGGNESSRFEPDPAVALVDGTYTQHRMQQRGQYGIKLTGRAYTQPSRHNPPTSRVEPIGPEKRLKATRSRL